MNYKLVGRTLGLVLFLEAITMVPSVLIAFYCNEQKSLMSFAFTALLLLIISIPLIRIKNFKKQIFSREGIAIVSLAWILMSLFGALPMFLSGEISTYIDAIFEAVSGFTTTGATIIEDVTVLPKSILFWRAFTHWLGGVGILVFILAFVTVFGGRAVYILRAEATGPNPGGKVVPRLRESISITYIIYGFLTILLATLLKIVGIPLFDSVLCAFSIAGTGGFGHISPSIEFFQNPAAEWIMATFMLIFSLNFSLFYFIVVKKFTYVYRNEELRWFLCIVGISTLLIYLNIHKTLYSEPLESLRMTFFQVTSIISTTGFSTTDFTKWPEMSQILLILLMFVGGCAGSTAGGMKVSRVVLMVKNTKRHLKSILHPRLYAVVRMDSQVVEEETLDQMGIYLINYFIIMLISFFLISLENFSFEVTISSVITCLNNVGPGLGDIGPYGNFAAFSNFSKLFLSVIMLIGRLEIFPVLLFFTPGLWRK